VGIGYGNDYEQLGVTNFKGGIFQDTVLASAWKKCKETGKNS
jgi:hypothetical protein